MAPRLQGWVCLALGLGLLTGCSSKDEAPSPAGSSVPPGPVPVAEGLSKTDDGWVYHTSEFSLDPSEERFLCYSMPTDEDLAIGRFVADARPFIHHFLFATALVPEKEGMTECNVLFKPTWSPMFIATTASADITMPDGAAKLIDKGTQLVLQLHLLNSTSKPVTGAAEIRMVQSHVENPEPVGIFAFGTTNIVLPPKQVTTVNGNCTVSSEARLFSMMPHMHYLGTRLQIDVGPDDANLKTVFVSDPYDFNEQKIEPLDLVLPAGSRSHIQCTYDNTRDTTIGFGESSLTEMCFGIGFTVGSKGPRACLAKLDAPDGGVPPAPGSGVCGDTEYPNGVGRKCTNGGGECGSDPNMTCTASFPGASDAGAASGICVMSGCGTSADCGGATCCAPQQAGGLFRTCMPEACRPASCIPIN